MSESLVKNTFGVQKSGQMNAIAEAGAQREIQEVQAAMIIAKRFPRDERSAMDRIINACSRPKLAQAAMYQYARGGTSIEGPSIRLAESVAQNWGNLQFGIREIEQTDGESIVETFAWDLETNTRSAKVFKVPHFRHTKGGGYKLTDPRDIYEIVANNGSRRLRACLLAVIPGDVIETAVDQCNLTMKSHEKITPEGTKAMVEAFGKFGVVKEQIEKRIQRRMDAITPALMANLRKIYTSMKDGMSSPAEWFDDMPVESKLEKKAPVKKSAPKEKVAAKPATKPADTLDMGVADGVYESMLEAFAANKIDTDKAMIVLVGQEYLKEGQTLLDLNEAQMKHLTKNAKPFAVNVAAVK